MISKNQSDCVQESKYTDVLFPLNSWVYLAWNNPYLSELAMSL